MVQEKELDLFKHSINIYKVYMGNLRNLLKHMCQGYSLPYSFQLSIGLGYKHRLPHSSAV